MIGSTNSIWDVKVKTYEQLINYTMLYDLGDECTEITGGWNALAGSSAWGSKITKNSDHIYMHSSTASATTKNKIDLIDYTAFYTVIKNATNMNTGRMYFLAGTVLYNQSGLGFNWDTWAKGASSQNTGNYVSKLYISEIDTPHYFSVMVSDSSNNAYASMYNSFIVKKDNWQELCTIAGLISSDYADETTLCANNSAITSILSRKNAVNYMIYNCTGSFMGEFIASDICLTALNNSPYKTKILENEHWAKFLSMVA